jgi:hypothetical protein
MSVMGGKFKNETKWSNCQKWFSFLVKSCECFRSSRYHRSMNAKNVIENLQRITKE